jgi:hypothetical protein
MYAEQSSSETMKLLEENMANASGWEWARIFWMKLQKQETVARIDKWDCIKIKSFCTTQEMINRLKRQPTELEELFSNHTSQYKTS